MQKKVYVTLQTVTNKESAFQIVHGFTENHARESRKKLDKLMRIPGLYRFVPALFAKGVKKYLTKQQVLGQRRIRKAAACGRWT